MVNPSQYKPTSLEKLEMSKKSDIEGVSYKIITRN